LVAVYSNPDSFANRLVALTVSGGNINTRLLSSVLMLRLVRSGRLLRLVIKISDLPGSLSRVINLLFPMGANIVEVQHERCYRDVPVSLAQLEAQV
jgi:threonine dehydratase